MDFEGFFKALDLEKEGQFAQAEELLCHLAEEENPFALFELANRYRPDVEISGPFWRPDKCDMRIAEDYAAKAIGVLQGLVAQGNAEAMRYLGNVYCGHYWPEYKNLDLVEPLWLKSFEGGCFFAANDLFVLYQGRDHEKATYWYHQAEIHNCRVVYHANYEAPKT